MENKIFEFKNGGTIQQITMRINDCLCDFIIAKNLKQEYFKKGKYTNSDTCYNLIDIPFILGDVIEELISGKEDELINFNIAYIVNTDIVNKADTINAITSIFKDEYIILADAYISEAEYPKEHYYLFEDEKTDGKEPLPIDYVLERESKILTDCGFISINDLVQYEYKVAFAYTGNEQGQKLVNSIKERLEGIKNE